MGKEVIGRGGGGGGEGVVEYRNIESVACFFITSVAVSSKYRRIL